MNDRPVRIWVVEDNEGDVYLFREAFRRAGVNTDILAIGDGAEALALIEIEVSHGGPAPDLVILDLNLPRADGIEVLKAMRRSKVFSKVPVVIASSIISPGDRASMEHLGVAQYFLKPSDLEAFFEVAAALKEALPGKPELQSTGPTR